jgi:hypothetical protein
MPLGSDVNADDPVPHPQSPAARFADPLNLQEKAEELDNSAPVPQNAPPVVSKDEAKTAGGISVTIKADQSGVAGVTGAATTMALDHGTIPEAETDANGNVSKLLGPMPTITAVVSTRYGTGKPGDKSAYGRGTTDDDKKNGDTSLGFHESCHRQDAINYLNLHALPKFVWKKGMTPAQWQQAKDDYDNAVDKYQADADGDSVQKTDEVGKPTKTQYKAANP